MSAADDFAKERRQAIARMAKDPSILSVTAAWLNESCRHRYSYNFTWLGRPIIQYPQDILAVQEILWQVRPDLVIETGIAHGGSLILSASILELVGGDGLVVGIDVDVRPHNRQAIEAHRLHKRIRMIEGSSVSPEVLEQVREIAQGRTRALVLLDSNHTHEHVRKELDLYSVFVKAGSYLVVFDTVIEDLPADAFPDRPWGKGNNPRTAVWDFMRSTDRFVIDEELQAKLLLTVAPDGYLKCIKD